MNIQKILKNLESVQNELSIKEGEVIDGKFANHLWDFLEEIIIDVKEFGDEIKERLDEVKGQLDEVKGQLNAK
jgi:hypothetical protein